MSLASFQYPSLRKSGLVFMTLALFSIAGGHWALLQGVAWANMICEYSTQESFQSAVQKTFSGKYRCPLCQKISIEKQKEKKAEGISEQTNKKNKGILEKIVSLQIFFPKKFSYPKVIDSNYSGPIMRPPSPYPR
ncbi:MAG: hypothetical protein A3F67_07230 [Verrucomicrobia bacterium RIFCSPHIGHO2_12_FULL_41_10]|nr:MAG: hypothetical protein A3F67_07230 [Verrucomicrobia bacterium RIFCSPHIGHO2_12_FULL_41_10]HLB34253.1 hypothetical protein [Chthoniobacterales bacterium]